MRGRELQELHRLQDCRQMKKTDGGSGLKMVHAAVTGRKAAPGREFSGFAGRRWRLFRAVLARAR